MSEKKQRLVKFVPMVCTEHEKKDPQTLEPMKDAEGKVIMNKPTFQGHIMLICPSFDERMGLLDNVGLKADAKGEVETDGVDAFTVLRKLVSVSEKFYAEVCLKRIEDGAEFKSFEDLSYDADCGVIMTEVGYALRKGFRPGKP